MPPDYIYDTTVCDVENHYAFGSFCSVHLDSDHTDDDPKVKAASCVYLSKSHHTGCSGHFVWDYINHRRLSVPTISNNQWNYFPLCPSGDHPTCAVLPHNHTHLTRLHKEMHANIGRKNRFVDDRKQRNIPNQCPSRRMYTSQLIMGTINPGTVRLTATILGVITLQLTMQTPSTQMLSFVDKIIRTIHPPSSHPLLKTWMLIL